MGDVIVGDIMGDGLIRALCMRVARLAGSGSFARLLPN